MTTTYHQPTKQLIWVHKDDLTFEAAGIAGCYRITFNIDEPECMHHELYNIDATFEWGGADLTDGLHLLNHHQTLQKAQEDCQEDHNNRYQLLQKAGFLEYENVLHRFLINPRCTANGDITESMKNTVGVTRIKTEHKTTAPAEFLRTTLTDETISNIDQTLKNLAETFPDGSNLREWMNHPLVWIVTRIELIHLDSFKDKKQITQGKNIFANPKIIGTWCNKEDIDYIEEAGYHYTQTHHRVTL